MKTGALKSLGMHHILGFIYWMAARYIISANTAKLKMHQLDIQYLAVDTFKITFAVSVTITTNI